MQRWRRWTQKKKTTKFEYSIYFFKWMKKVSVCRRIRFSLDWKKWADFHPSLVQRCSRGAGCTSLRWTRLRAGQAWVCSRMHVENDTLEMLVGNACRKGGWDLWKGTGTALWLVLPGRDAGWQLPGFYLLLQGSVQTTSRRHRSGTTISYWLLFVEEFIEGFKEYEMYSPQQNMRLVK